MKSVNFLLLGNCIMCEANLMYIKLSLSYYILLQYTIP